VSFRSYLCIDAGDNTVERFHVLRISEDNIFMERLKQATPVVSKRPVSDKSNGWWILPFLVLGLLSWTLMFILIF
jgi:hypothetical protein